MLPWRAAIGAILGVASVGCVGGVTSYTITLREPSQAEVSAQDSWEKDGPTPLACGAQPGCEARVKQGKHATITGSVGYSYAAEPRPDGTLHLVYRDSAGGARSKPIFNDKRSLLFADRAAFISGVWPGLYFNKAQLRGNQLTLTGWDIVYGDSDAGHGTLAFDLSLQTRTDNVERVVQKVEYPRSLGIMAVAISALIAGGGAYLTATGPTPAFRYGVGLPLIGAGAGGLLVGGIYLSRPAQTVRELSPEALGALPR
jgi:hypothetical protein